MTFFVTSHSIESESEGELYVVIDQSCDTLSECICPKHQIEGILVGGEGESAMVEAKDRERNTSRSSEVTNQCPPLVNYDLYGSDAPLLGYLERVGVELSEVAQLGEWLGSGEAIEHGRLANAYPPVLRSFDSSGRRLDEVEYHASYHYLMDISVGAGIAAFPVKSLQGNDHLKRCIALYLVSQNEAGHACPLSMTYACLPALAHNPELMELWGSRLRSKVYDFGLRSPLSKAGLLAGMGMTEKQGGSDVRATETTASPIGGEWRVSGHKWFCSAPMSDLFFILAQAPGGLSCFALPRVLEDGTKNSFLLQRLKDKVGNRSNASAEVEFDDSTAYLIGEEGRGVKTILEMVSFCRLDSLISSTAQMRQALLQAAWFATHRRSFGEWLIDQDLMQNVLLELTLESNAATLTSLRIAQSADMGAADPAEVSFRRLCVGLAKFFVCKRAPGFVAEAMECLGGNGYVEESILARLFRESPLNGVWEGTGNVNALDVQRTLRRDGVAMEAYLAELRLALGANSTFDNCFKGLVSRKFSLDDSPWGARELVVSMALALQASLMIRYDSQEMADLFCHSRLDGGVGGVYGTLPRVSNAKELIAQSLPLIA